MTPLFQMLHLYATLILLHQKAWALRHFLDEREDDLEDTGSFYHPAIVALARAYLDSLISWCYRSLILIHRALISSSKDLT